MLKNYIKIAWRNLAQHKSYTLINLFGLTVGMACCILISLYVKSELSFDTFHEKSDRIVATGYSGGFFSNRSLSTPYPLADALVDEIPEVEKAVRISGTGDLNLSKDGETYTVIEDGKFTESSFFDVFSFELISGNKENLLAAPNTAVLTESAAKQIFGDRNPMGQSLIWQKRDTVINLEVTGVLADVPPNSSLKFELLVSQTTRDEDRLDPSAWNSFYLHTYALLNSPEALEIMPTRLDTLMSKHYENREGSSSDRSMFTILLEDLHLSEVTRDEGFTGNRAYVYLFGSVALFILLIACVNYVNLATARASLRSREVGVRKTLGALRMQVAGQFVGESMIISFTAFIFGTLVAVAVMPFFNDLFETALVWYSNISLLLWLMIGALGVGILAGLYPSLYLSGFTPVKVLRGRKSSGSSGSILRKSLVVGQFAIALTLIIGSLIVYQQLQYTQTKDLGFEGDQVVMVTLPNRTAWEQREAIKNTVRGFSGIDAVSVSMGAPGSFNVRMGMQPDNLAPENNVDSEESVMYAPAVVDYDFIDLLKIDLVAGRNFSRDMGSDAEGAFILNETGAKQLGWTPEEAIGKSFTMGTEGTIVGVVEDFHISSLHDDIDAVVLQLQTSSSFYSSGILLAKLQSGQIRNALDLIEPEISKFAPNTDFKYEFLDDKFDAMYRTEIRFGKVVGLFTFIAIIIACLGLYGLAAFSAERRIKEIGVRKVLGATVTNIVALLSKDFLKLVILGFIIAIPVAWYGMNQWLADFAYRIEIGPLVFFVAGLAAIVIAFLTVSWQSVQAAVANPVDSLRSE